MGNKKPGRGFWAGVAGVVCLALTGWGLPAQGAPVFASALGYASGWQPGDMVVADFNGDGRPDVAVGEGRSGTLSLFLGQGDGSLSLASRTYVGSRQVSVFAGDFNGDGRQDVGVLQQSSLQILLGQGDGRVTALPLQLTGVLAGSRAVTGDVNGDGRGDLLWSTSTGLVVAYGRGEGSFADPLSLAGGVSGSSLLLGDFTGDGRPDLVVADATQHQLLFLAGLSGGGFAAPRVLMSFGGSVGLQGLLSGDVNGDGHPDLVLADGSTVISVLLGQGEGVFQGPLDTRVDIGVDHITLGDVNGDGRLDVVGGASLGNDLVTLLGQPGGGFQAVYSPGGAVDSNSLALADLDGDGRPELLTALQTGSQVGVLRAFANGQFMAAASLPVPTGYGQGALLGADVDGNGWQDLVFLGTAGVQAWLNRQAQAIDVVVSPDTAGDYRAAAVLDADRDGRPDVVAVRGASPPQLVVLAGQGGAQAGQFRLAGNLVLPADLVGELSGLLVGDFDGDGYPDLALTGSVPNVTNPTGSPVPRLLVLAGNPLRVWGQWTGVRAVDRLDFNGDGVTDLVTYGAGGGGQSGGQSGGKSYGVLLGGAGGMTAIPLGDLTGSYPGSTDVAVDGSALRTLVAVGDLNGDGRGDLLFMVPYADGRCTLSLLAGRRDGESGALVSRESTVCPTGFASSAGVRDLDGDGKADLLLLDSRSPVLYRGSGDGGLLTSERYAAAPDPIRLVLGDYTGDRRADALVVSRSGRLSFFLNISP